MPATTIDDLRDALGLGLGIVTRIWEYKTEGGWVTSVFAADIDNDGDIEVIACSRQGRVIMLSKEGDCRWVRVLGANSWVGTAIASDFLTQGENTYARIIVGTRNGKVYTLAKDGKTVDKDGQAFPFDQDGRTIESEKVKKACWYDTKRVIRQVYVDPETSDIIIGSEDRCAYALDYKTGEQRWKFLTHGSVQAVCSYDINRDGKAEILIGSADEHLYVLNHQGQLLTKYNMKYPVHTILATDIDHDGQIEILVGMDGKDLVALIYLENKTTSTRYFAEKWRQHFDKYLLSLCVTDIDGDGCNEIIAGSQDKHIYILDAEGKTIWRHNHKYRVCSIYPYDIDNDGMPELLVGSDNGKVSAMRIRLRKGLERKIRKCYRQLGEPELDTLTELTVNERNFLQDILRKEVKEYATLKQVDDLIKAGEHAHALSTLIKLRQQKVQQLWHRDITGHVCTVCIRHIASDPKCEVIVGSTKGHIEAFNANGRHLRSTHLNSHVVDVQTGFIDRHKQEEIVVCSSDHYVYILGGMKKREQRIIYIDTWMSSICVTAPNRQSPAEILIGSEDRKVYIYGDDLTAPIETISTPEGIRIVRAYTPNEENMPEIIAGGLSNRVYAYTRSGKCLWTYETRDDIRTICVKDINGDGNIEILVGSEDRNIHVLDSTGKLLWRYYLPDSVLAIDVADIDHDGKAEIFVGSADGCMYVFNREGELLWEYQTSDRVLTVRIEDIDDDGNTEIAIGSEQELEIVRVVNQRQVNTLINQCWSALRQKEQIEQLISKLVHDSDPSLQAFALDKFAERDDFSAKDFDFCEKFVKESAIEVRKILIRIMVVRYSVYPSMARHILHQLSIDTDQEVKNAFVEQIPTLMKNDWELGFQYIKHFSENADRYVRRATVRKLHQVIDAPVERTMDRHNEIFDLLLTAAKDKESEWIRQEAARSLAHFLNRYNGNLMVYLHLFIVKGIQPSILRQIAHATTAPVVKHVINAAVPLLYDLNNDNVLERLQQFVKALEGASALIYGKENRSIYAELYRLFTIDRIDDIASYQCSLHSNQRSTDNQLAQITIGVLDKLGSISRPLRIYLKRESVQDRLSSLLETSEAIGKMNKYLEQQYSILLLGEPIAKLPNYTLFLLLFKKWQEIVTAQLNELRGKAEITAELQTKYAHNEDQVGIWLSVRNIGHSSADDVKITLLHNNNIDVIGSNSFTTETIPPQEETIPEFVIRPHATTVDLVFEIVYEDADKIVKIDKFPDRLELRESHQEFRYIPNPYSTGTPTQDSKMFYGREEDMAFLRNNLTRDAKTVIVLYGQRRSGKTTLLLQLMNGSALDEHIPVLIDMQRASYNISINNFLHRVAYYIAQAMKKKHLLIRQPELDDFQTDPTHSFDIFLDNVEEQLVGQKLIFLIDEFEVLEEQVVKGRLHPEIFEYLRDIIQYRHIVNCLFSGTHKITKFTKWYRSVFFNIARHHRLSKLSSQGAEDLIQKPVAGYLEYEPLTVKKIRQLTADQPYLLHLMCRSIVDYCNDKRKTYVTINDVNTVLREVMQTGQFHFDWLWDQIAPEERVALSAIAEAAKEEGRWLSLVEIEEIFRRWHIPYKREYLQTSLKTLMDADIIESISSDSKDSTFDGIKFRIPVGLTRGWLLKERPLELVQKEMSS